KQKIRQIDSMNLELQRHTERIEATNRSLEQRVKELSLLQQASQVITSSLELQKTLEAVASMSKEILRSSHCAIRLIDDEFKRIWSVEEQALEQLQAPGPAGTNSVSVPLKVADRVLGYFEVYSESEDVLGDDQRRVLQVLASQAAIAIENARLFETTQQTYYETIRSLAQALEARDAYTRGHSERVTRYAIATARCMGLSERSLRIIRYAGLLHDIGKIGIADSILNKRLELTEQEWTTIRNHPLFGDAILEPLKFLHDAQHIVLHHHERWDGSGYPNGLKGTEIPLEARIVAVADAFDAMTSHRPYRAAMAREKAIEELRASAGKQFDPEVVEAFLTAISESATIRGEPDRDHTGVTT
ncbi:MAG: HD domain-containing protein, partial [Deltaproteobacteria bacterium]